MDLLKLAEQYAKRAEADRREAANALAKDIYSAIEADEGPLHFVPNAPPAPRADATQPPNAPSEPESVIEQIERECASERLRGKLTPLANFPAYLPEAENPAILIKGRWLERGGSAWWISTAGTGKSIASVQLSLLWSEGLPFAGLTPNRGPLTVWIIQSEDSPSRVTIDREDTIAELSEQYPAVDWRKTAERVKFLKLGPFVGAAFLDALDETLDLTRRNEAEKMPDIIIMNPFLAFIGGPITDGEYVTPFLRGGEINRNPTVGLQAILEKYDIAALIFHHTPKPPNDDQLDGWMKSAYPEYQGAGSSDITNWGRSFITMMKVKGDPRKVVLTAGKNGGEIGWAEIDGANRHYLAYSDAQGITGNHRHAWRELAPEEMAEVTANAPKSAAKKREIDTAAAARWLAENAPRLVNMTEREIQQFYRESLGDTAAYSNITRKVPEVVAAFLDNLPDGYAVAVEKRGKTPSRILTYGAENDL